VNDGDGLAVVVVIDSRGGVCAECEITETCDFTNQFTRRCVRTLHFTDPSPLPTICLENLTPDQIRAYVIADKRLAEDADWNEQILKIELQQLISLPEIDVSITGFERTEIDFFIGSAAAEEDPDDQLPKKLPRLSRNEATFSVWDTTEFTAVMRGMHLRLPRS